MTEIGQGFTLSLIGILVTFFALGTLILLILLLKLAFPARRADRAGAASHPEEDSREALRKKAAAAGVAALLGSGKTARPGSLGALLEAPAGNWWKRGIDRIHGKD